MTFMTPFWCSDQTFCPLEGERREIQISMQMCGMAVFMESFENSLGSTCYRPTINGHHCIRRKPAPDPFVPKGVLFHFLEFQRWPVTW